MVKPCLPLEIQERLPSEIIHIIQQFVPHMPLKKKQVSPSLQKQLTDLQKKGGKKTDMYLKDLDDFVLD